MKRLFSPLAFLASSSLALAFAQDPVQLRLIGINDFHGNLEPPNLQLQVADPGAAAGAAPLRLHVGGAAAIADMVKRLRAGSPESFMVAGGDLIGAAPLPSSLFMHESTVEILNDIGLDVASVGNHEFDAGIAELRRVIAGGCARSSPDGAVTSCVQHQYKGTRWQYLAANVVDERGRHVIAPYMIKRFKGIPVGFIGGVTRTTPQLVIPSGVAGLKFLDEAESVNRAAVELRRKGVKAMVAIFHEGIELGNSQKRGDWNDTSCPDAHGPLLDIARRLAPEIKVIFSGHTHQGYRCEIDGRLLIQGTSYGRGISVVDVELDRSTGAMLPPVRSINLPVVNEATDKTNRERIAASLEAPFAKVLRETQPDAAIAAKVAHYAALAKPKADRPVGRIAGAFTRGGYADSNMGRLIADSQMAATRALGAQAALMNPGGIRANLDCAAPPCLVTFGQVFTVQPFGNSLVVMSLSGELLKALLESQLTTATGNPVFLQPSAELTYTWQSDAPPGLRVRDLRIAGEPVRDTAVYRITVNSFLAEGGDGFVLLAKGLDRKGGGQDIDALMNYLAAAERAPVPDARITRLPPPEPRK